MVEETQRGRNLPVLHNSHARWFSHLGISFCTGILVELEKNLNSLIKQMLNTIIQPR